MKSAIKLIKEHFPKVEHVVDSRNSITITVQEKHVLKARKKDPMNCALAKACVSEGIADGAIIGLAYSYLIRGETATRYKTSIGVSREITSFDRHADFDPGMHYRLSKISPSNRLGVKRIPHKGGKIRQKLVHTTANIRVMQ